MTRALLMCWIGIVCCLAYMVLAGCGSCQYPPGPQPATGGTAATGGSAGTGGAATGGNEAAGGTTASGGTGTGGSPPVDDCEAAERRLQQLDCRTADGAPRWLTPAGTPLAVVCRAREVDGDSMCPNCLAHVASCAGIDACRPRQTGVCPQ